MIKIMSQDFFDYISTLKHRRCDFSAGELIFERADPVDCYFGVFSGEIHLVRRQEDGTVLILQRAPRGAVLAEASLFSPHYHCSAVAAAPSQLLVFSRADVLSLVNRDRAVAQAMIKHLGNEVRNARLKAEIVSLRRVRDRLDAWLAWNDHALPEKGSWHRVALEIGVSTEALYRELARRR